MYAELLGKIYATSINSGSLSSILFYDLSAASECRAIVMVCRTTLYDGDCAYFPATTTSNTCNNIR